MFIRKFFTKLSITIAVVVLLASGAVWEIRHVRAMPTAVEFDPAFGIVGITRGETMRLNVVNLLAPGWAKSHPAHVASYSPFAMLMGSHSRTLTDR